MEASSRIIITCVIYEECVMCYVVDVCVSLIFFLFKKDALGSDRTKSDEFWSANKPRAARK